MVLAAVKFSALDLCYQGKYLAAAESLGLRVGEWPENVSESDSAHAEACLVAGIISSTLAGIQQSADQDTAKAMLRESIRLFGDDLRSLEAECWLGRAYYWTGEYDEALGLADDVLSGDIGNRLRFWTLLLKVIVYMRQGRHDLALTACRDMEPLYDEQNSLLKGKFHNQRANVFQVSGEIDRAIAEYDFATDFFKLAGDIRCQAIAVNNLASLYRDTERYEDAHVHANKARVLFEQLGDKTYQAKALDQSATIYLSEGKLEQAENSISQAISLLTNDDPVLTECVRTYAKIKHPALIVMKDDCDTLAANPRPTLPDSHERREPAMTLLSCANRILENPDNALPLYDLLVFASAARGDPLHEAVLARVEAMIHSMTPDGEEHRSEYRQSRLNQIVTSDS